MSFVDHENAATLNGDAKLTDVVKELRTLRELLASDRAELLTREQAATLLGVSPATIDRMRASGELPAPVMLRGSVRYRREDLKRFIADLAT